MNKLWWLFFLIWSTPVLADMSSSVDIKKPFARSALQQQRNSAVFMTVFNSGKNAAIVNATSPAADIVELHTHINDQGVMRMRRIDKIDLPAGIETTLKPGGLHIMLIGLRRDLNIGDEVNLTVEFEDGSQQLLTAPVHKVMPMKHMKKQHTMMRH